MRTTLSAALTFVMLLSACGRSALRKSDSKEYETVEEGSASGVTSTIQGPGETVPSITGTNADMTSAFALDPNAAAATAAPVASAPVVTAPVEPSAAATTATTPLPDRRLPEPQRPPVPEPSPVPTQTTATEPIEPKEKTDNATTAPPEDEEPAETTTTTEPPPPPR